MQRVATSIIGVPIIVALIWLGGAWYSVALAFFLVVAALEFYAALAPAPAPARGGPASGGNPTLIENPLAAISPLRLPRLLNQRPLGLMGVAFVALLVAGAHHGGDWWAGAMALAAVLPFLWLTLTGDVDRALGDWLTTVGGVLYIGWLGSHLEFLRQLDNGRDWVFLAVFATFANDTSAYFVGHALGRTKLVPHISPGKTLEGSLGGLIFGALGLLLLNYALGLRLDAAAIVPLAFLVPVAAQLGDLAESLIKRGAHVKDASVVVPGHGGVLDRLDSVLFVAPVVYYYAIWVVL
ncbi:MAG: phosphatidate cytidylyltransferase [Chloroflexota bacterium]|nr:phosphatidate cytidylyltransferase [Chloroflexota bacterium]